jgi:hypothetical protein
MKNYQTLLVTILIICCHAAEGGVSGKKPILLLDRWISGAEFNPKQQPDALKNWNLLVARKNGQYDLLLDHLTAKRSEYGDDDESTFELGADGLAVDDKVVFYLSNLGLAEQRKLNVIGFDMDRQARYLGNNQWKWQADLPSSVPGYVYNVHMRRLNSKEISYSVWLKLPDKGQIKLVQSNHRFGEGFDPLRLLYSGDFNGDGIPDLLANLGDKYTVFAPVLILSQKMKVGISFMTISADPEFAD